MRQIRRIVHVRFDCLWIVRPIALKGLHFRNVQSLTVYIKDNHGAETTVIYKMKLVGSLAADTSKQALKKVPVTGDTLDLY